MTRTGKQGMVRQLGCGAALGAGRVCREGEQGGPRHFKWRLQPTCKDLRTAGAMVSTWLKAVPSVSLMAPPAARIDAVTQTELSRDHAAVQIQGCRVCPSFRSVSDGSSELTCGRCAQVKELLRLVTELQEDVSRLRSTEESENGIDWWNFALPSLRQMDQPTTAQETKDSLPSHH